MSQSELERFCRGLRDCYRMFDEASDCDVAFAAAAALVKMAPTAAEMLRRVQLHCCNNKLVMGQLNELAAKAMEPR